MIMFENEIIPAVVVRVKSQRKQQNFSMNIAIDAVGDVDLNQILFHLRNLESFEETGLIFYLDCTRNLYTFINSQQTLRVHYTCLICQNLINIRIEPKMSDQLLANPEVDQEEVRTKRKQRFINEVFLMVEQWRLLYREGTINEKKQKMNLEQACQLLQAPRKSLEDYYLLLRQGMCLNFDFRTHLKDKIGVLRRYVRQKGKPKEDKNFFQEDRFFKKLREQLFGDQIEEQEVEETIFQVLCYPSSDEQMLSEN